MSTINQIRANRRNAKKSTGPTSQAGRDKVRFNALDHGCRAASVLIPGEDSNLFDQHLARITEAWQPVDDMEHSLVQQIAITQWKLARLDRHEALLYADSAATPAELTTLLHRHYLTQTRLERSVSQTIADLARYRAERIERQKVEEGKEAEKIRMGLIWRDESGGGVYAVLPSVLGLDGIWRQIPREILGDFSKSPQPNQPKSS